MVDDEIVGRCSLATFLRKMGFTVDEESDGLSALASMSSTDYQLVITDNLMPGLSGIELLRAIRNDKDCQGTDVVIVTAFSDQALIAEALQYGAFDYLEKPINLNELLEVIECVAKLHISASDKSGSFPDPDNQPVSFADIDADSLNSLSSNIVSLQGLKRIGVYSQAMQAVINLALRLHSYPSTPVIIEGETGTGKELIARYIHQGQGTEFRPFVALNSAALTPSVFESELFGYESGSFTGGLANGKKGKLDLAQGGTLFLDEISEMQPDLQAKLLRVLEEHEYYRIGGMELVKTDARIICATNENLAEMVEAGTFRKDLFYRLSMGRIRIMPLRSQSTSILPLARMLLRAAAIEKHKSFKTISGAAARMLLSYQWPGNVRELRNVIEWSVMMWDDTVLRPSHLGSLLDHEATRSDAVSSKQVLNIDSFSLPADQLPINVLYDRIVFKALEMHGGSKTDTAKYLDISRNTLAYRLKKMDSIA